MLKVSRNFARALVALSLAGLTMVSAPMGASAQTSVDHLTAPAGIGWRSGRSSASWPARI